MSTELTTPIKIEIPGIGTIESADLYLKSEADKVIADLEESHKMEVEQLLMEIVERMDGLCAICYDGEIYPHCAEIPDPPKPRRATNRELARWLAQGNGEWKLEGPVSKEDQCSSDYVYLEINENYKLDCDILVRKWSDTEWHEPTVDYLFGKTYKEAK